MTTVINRYFGIVLDLSSIMTKNISGTYEYYSLLEYLYLCESDCFSGYQPSMPANWNPTSGLPSGNEQKIVIIVPYNYYDTYTNNISDIYNIFKDTTNFDIFKKSCIGHCYLITSINSFMQKTLVGIYTLCTHFKNIQGNNPPEITPFRQRVRRDTANFTPTPTPKRKRKRESEESESEESESEESENLTPIVPRRLMLGTPSREESSILSPGTPIITPTQPVTTISVTSSAPVAGWGSIVMECIIDSILSNYPIESIIWLGVKVNDNPFFGKAVSLYTKFGFDNPILTNTDPFGQIYPFYFISLHRQNKYMFINDIDSVSAFNHVLYTIDEKVKRSTRNILCSMNFYFEKFYAIYLERLCFTTLSVKNNVVSQKEIAGEFIINKLYCQINNHQKCPINWLNGVDTPPDFLWEISYNKDTILYKDIGTEHDVNVTNASYFTFHTHPKNTYLLYNTSIGYPSGPDYSFTLKNYDTTIFHAVITMEGIYIISFTEKFLLFKQEQKEKPYGKPIPILDADLKFISQYYDKDKATFERECIANNITNKIDQINEYIRQVNSIRINYLGHISEIGELTGLSNGTQGPVQNLQLFNVYFKNWNDIYKQDASSVFNVKYSCINNQCFINEKIRDSVRQLYSPLNIPQ